MSYIEDFLHSFADDSAFKLLNSAMQDSIFPFLVLVLAALAFIALKDRNARLSLFFTFVITIFLVPLLKQIYGEARPCDGLTTCGSDYGFPSGHAAMSFAIATSMFGTKFFYVFVLLAVFISLFRVVSGVHSFPQVVAGAVLGFIVSTTVSIAVQKLSSFIGGKKR